jgi:hypothetical protein
MYGGMEWYDMDEWTCSILEYLFFCTIFGVVGFCLLSFFGKVKLVVLPKTREFSREMGFAIWSMML